DWDGEGFRTPASNERRVVTGQCPVQPLNELLRVAIDITRPAATDKFLPPRFAMPREG
ncbi:MAG: hypothetical protein QOK38_3233, partial [Acidobacteriaceae bacterium]|nr:hypothetical protein [Acidobacteriaceae bacterium]